MSIHDFLLKLDSHVQMESRYGRLQLHTASVNYFAQEQAKTLADEIKSSNIDLIFFKKCILDLEKYKESTIVKQILVNLYQS